MGNLNAEQIVKALECCIDITDLMKCQSCPYYDNKSCHLNLKTDAFSLIKQLTEEVNDLKEDKELYSVFCEDYKKQIEDLEAISKQYQKQFEDCYEEKAKLTEENERLSGAVKQYEEERKYHFEMSRTRIAEAKADTVRKMQTALWANLSPYSNYTTAEVGALIDQIAKEMVEGMK